MHQVRRKVTIQKTVFMRNQSRFFLSYSKRNIKNLLGDFNAKVGQENIFKPIVGNESLHQVSNDNGVRIVNFATSINLVVKSTMFPHRNIRTYTSTSPDGKADNQIVHILIDRRWHSSTRCGYKITGLMLEHFLLKKLHNRNVVTLDVLPSPIPKPLHANLPLLEEMLQVVF